MAKTERHKWVFRARFRKHGFGWRSQLPIKRIKEAVSEIKKVARKDKALAADGAVLLIEKLSPALENVDSSSGSIGTAVNNAIEALVPVIAGAPANAKKREAWLERLWDAYEADEMPYLERLGEHWGALCALKEVASRWADGFVECCRLAWNPELGVSGSFKSLVVCLSSLLAAERYEELLQLLESEPHNMWWYRVYGVRALAALGKKADAIRYAEDAADGGHCDDLSAVALECEGILLSSGLSDEAYRRYGILANQRGTYLAWFRAVAKKYPQLEPAQILGDLVASTPGDEGKWFAAAKSAGLFDEAIALVKHAYCSPQTLVRAARDFEEKRPAFAIEAGIAALDWLVQGYGYDVTSVDVHAAFAHTMNAAMNADRAEATFKRIRALVAAETVGERFVSMVLGRRLGLR